MTVCENKDLKSVSKRKLREIVFFHKRKTKNVKNKPTVKSPKLLRKVFKGSKVFWRIIVIKNIKSKRTSFFLFLRRDAGDVSFDKILRLKSTRLLHKLFKVSKVILRKIVICDQNQNAWLHFEPSYCYKIWQNFWRPGI